MDSNTLKELVSSVAGKHGFRPVIVEKDYYLTTILNGVDSHLSKDIVFKGGTLLNKVHLNYHRLSEDLDFTYFSGHGLNSRSQRSKAIKPIREKMPEFLHHVGLRSDKPVHSIIKHFYQDPFTGEDLIPSHKVLSLSFKEAVAEKLKAAITRKDAVIRDYFDLWHISQAKFDFHDAHFISLFKKKLADEGHGDKEYRHNFGLSEEKVKQLRAQVGPDLLPVIRAGERFDLDKVLNLFNGILADV